MEKIINTLKSCDSQVVISKNQAKEIIKSFERLEEDANLGKQYKKSLIDDVVALCSKSMPQMDIKAFSSVAQVMTTSELMAFKKAFSQSNYNNDVELQIKSKHYTNSDVSEFKV